MQEPATDQYEVNVALDAARAHARAAGALATLSLAPALTALEPLAEALDGLIAAGETRPAALAAAGLSAARHAAGAPLTPHTLRLVADALADPASDAVAAELRRAALNTPRERAPLATAFSGLSLLTRALAARTGKDFTLDLDVGGVLAAADQLDPWRKAAMTMAEFILARAPGDTVSLALTATDSGAGVIRLTAPLPAGVRVQAAFSVADALTRALADETAESMLIDTTGEFAALEEAAAELGGSVAVETLADGGQRLVMLAGRPAYPPFRPRLRTVSTRPVRRAARSAA